MATRSSWPTDSGCVFVQIDTPEVHGGYEWYGPPASAIAKRLLAVGTRVRAEPTAIVMHPRTWKTLAKLKMGIAGDLTYLVNSDAQSGAARQLFGIPAYLSGQLSIVMTKADTTPASVNVEVKDRHHVESEVIKTVIVGRKLYGPRHRLIVPTEVAEGWVAAGDVVVIDAPPPLPEEPPDDLVAR